MSFVKLEAPNQEVVDYLTKLWNTTKKDNQMKPQSNSLIQTLLDNNLLDNQPVVTIQETTETPVVQDIIVCETPEIPVVQEVLVDNPIKIDEPVVAIVEPIICENNTVIPDQPNPETKVIKSDFPEINLKNNCVFKKQVKENLAKLREIGFRAYYNANLEKEVNLAPKEVTSDDINKVYDFKTMGLLTKRALMKDISHCIIYPKYKFGENNKPESFRYLVNHHNVIKILDRLWCIELNNKINSTPDPQIYKTSLFGTYHDAVSDVAVKNTESMESVVLLDIEKAYDSLEWDVLENLLLSNLSRKTSVENAVELVEQYMIILKNRELYYKDNLISVSKGISTGLPSSSLVFTLALEEIIHMWFETTKYENNKDFIMNIFVDDIYLNILNKPKSKEIINSLINFLGNYQLMVNKNKSKADVNLDVDIPSKLIPSDFYLGIPFTRDLKLYGKLILSQFNNNKLDMTWNEIYDELSKDSSDENVLENQRIIIGYMGYKLKPFLNNDSQQTIKEQIQSVIAKIKTNRCLEHLRKQRMGLLATAVIFAITTVIILKFSLN